MKARMCFSMLFLGLLTALSACAAEKETKETALSAGNKDVGAETARAKAVSLTSEMDKVSYAIGSQIGQNFKRQGIEIKLEILMQGITDAMEGKDPALSQEEIREVMTSFQQRMRQQMQERRTAEGAKNLAEGTAFLETNKNKQGVKALASGLQYKVIKEGTGNTPTANDKVKTHYRGRLIDGTEFDSSYKRGKPAEFAVKGVIKGWTEALQLMKEGGKWELYIPANLAYAERGTRGIPPNSTLIFEIELLEVVK
ncbi:MAG: FKBP-type peptidyl-prolyl cis-trans isomerase [Planctomycetota bacterium]